MISLKNIHQYYGDFHALKGLNIEIPSREVIGLLGPNGAGKTTLMRVISGYRVPSKGEVFIDGVSVQKNTSEVQKKIGYLPEIPPIYPEMTVEEYLYFCADLKTVAVNKRKEEVEYACEKLFLTDRRKQLISQLSKGYKQRLGIAMAILGDVSLVILDEPMVGLDPTQIKETRKLIKELVKEKTVILSSHILSEVEANCSRIIVLHEGSIELNDTKENVLKTISRGEKLKINLVKVNVQLSKQLHIRYPSVEIKKNQLIFPSSDLNKDTPEIIRSVIEYGGEILEVSPIKTQLESIFGNLK